MAAIVDEPWRMDGADVARLIRLGRISCREVIDSVLARLEAVNPAINAVVLPLAAEARAAAEAADRAVRRGDRLGPLHGVPVTTKVNVDQRGCPTDNGVVANKELIAAEDNPVVANLRRAGAIVVGRTNTPAYSMRWFTDNALHGATLNPWNPAHTPGGSSGGAGAAVAAGIGAIAHGNDIAGSVRYPAYCCGVVGLKPGYGRIPSHNGTSTAKRLISSALMAVQGPLARRVKDVRLGFAAMAVPDPRDPRCVDMPLVGAPPPRPIRVALVADPGRRGVDPAIAAAVRRAGLYLTEAGYAVEEIDPPAFAEAGELWPRLAMDDVIAAIEPYAAQHGDEGIRQALGLWRAVWPARDPAECLAALAERDSLLTRWEQFLAGCPLVLAPVSTRLPFAVGMDTRDKETTARIIAAQLPQMAISVLGLPAVSVPVGLEGGLPVGVQLIAGRFREDLCLDAAEIIEARAPMPTPVDPRR